MTEDEARAAVVAEALTWQGTPYLHRGRVKGTGVDCASLILCSYVGAGVVPDRELPEYSPQWHINQDAQRYLAVILDHAGEVAGPPERTPKPADVVVWQIGRTFSHGALVIAWPTVIHAVVRTSCHLDDVSTAEWLTKDRAGKPRPVRYFSKWG